MELSRLSFTDFSRLSSFFSSRNEHTNHLLISKFHTTSRNFKEGLLLVLKTSIIFYLLGCFFFLSIAFFLFKLKSKSHCQHKEAHENILYLYVVHEFFREIAAH